MLQQLLLLCATRHKLKVYATTLYFYYDATMHKLKVRATKNYFYYHA